MSADQGHIKLLGAHRRDETFVVSGHEYVDFLSHGTVLERCTVQIQGSARGVVFHAATLRHCLVHAKKEFKNFSWHDVKLEECRFQGRFTGCDFGSRPDAYPDRPRGVVVDCDFSQTKLHLCRFFNCEMSRIRLPGWPCLTLLDPAKNALDWLAIVLPEPLRIEHRLLGDPNEGESACVIDVEQWCRKKGVEPERVRDLLASKPYVLA